MGLDVETLAILATFSVFIIATFVIFVVKRRKGK